MDVKSRQVVAFHVGDRSRRSARKLWKKLPDMYREQAKFYTDAYQPYHYWSDPPSAYTSERAIDVARTFTSQERGLETSYPPS